MLAAVASNAHICNKTGRLKSTTFMHLLLVYSLKMYAQQAVSVLQPQTVCMSCGVYSGSLHRVLDLMRGLSLRLRCPHCHSA